MLHDEVMDDESPPIWPAFGDLMACLFGLFVLFFVWAVSLEGALAKDLKEERESRKTEALRLASLEQALAGPLSAGSITLVDGRIGIRGSVLFDVNRAELKEGGALLLRELVGPLRGYLEERSELLMVSGFTDDMPIRGGGNYRDNWELSTERALTVTRALIDLGMPSDALFAAGFGETHPAAPNDSVDNRAKNRRVEIAPVPRLTRVSP